MGRRGPRPKPTEIKKLEGNPGHRPLNEDTEPKPPKPAGSPPAPKHITGDARKEWKRIVPVLYDLGLITNVDIATLEGYCLAYGKAMKAERDIQRKGLFVMTDAGRRANPAVKIAKESWGQVRQFAQEFGLTPSARTRVSAGDSLPPVVPPAPGEPADKNEAFLFGPRLAS